MLAENRDKRIYIKAKKAVVLRTGGFENNQAMIRDYLGKPVQHRRRDPDGDGDRCGSPAHGQPGRS